MKKDIVIASTGFVPVLLTLTRICPHYLKLFLFVEGRSWAVVVGIDFNIKKHVVYVVR